jgi:N-acetylneuraminic acid mutarotase
MGGSSTVEALSVYGSLGVAASGNMPGARISPQTWTDKKGNLWLFGGVTQGLVDVNDLWEFNPSTNQWALVEAPSNLLGVYGTMGKPAPGNIPPGRSGATTWTDSSGNLWLFGGSYALISTDWTQVSLSDLWEFNTTTLEWTWMGGPSQPNESGVYGTLSKAAEGNVPGARSEAAGWVDSAGNLWLFGGGGYDSTGTKGNLNDVWEFSPSTGLWTWVNGPNIANQAAVPGTKSAPAPGNLPPPGGYNVTWSDYKGNFWIFGGSLGTTAVWKYIPAENEWAWMSGSNTDTETLSSPGQPGVYGTFGSFSPANTPGNRGGAVGWSDTSGNLWLLGGVGPDANGNEGFLNDFWEYSTATNEWAWMGGSSTEGYCPVSYNFCGELPVVGPLDTPGLALVPSGRYDSAAWTGSDGHFWLLGGIGIDQEGNGGYLDDLWEFQPNTNSKSVAATPSLSLASGSYSSWQTLKISDSTPGATIYYSVNGSFPDMPYAGAITISSSETIEAIATEAGFANSNIAAATYTLDLAAAPTPVFSVPTGSYTTAQTVSITDSVPGSTIYYAIGGTPNSNYSTYTGPLSVNSSESIQAFAVADNYSTSSVATAQYNIGQLPATTNSWVWMGGASTLASICYANAYTLTSCARPGWYGTRGQPAVGNTPGGRVTSAGWTDKSGNLWLFGGDGYDGAGTSGLLNDMWMYNPSTGEWTWMGGSAIIGDSCPAQVTNEYCGKPGVYGTQGAPSASNVPGGRVWPTYWTDKDGHFWLFGGEGFDANGVLGFLDDLWEYDPSTNEWTWEGGHSTFSGLFDSFAGIYGTQGVPSPQNWPGTRWYTTHWVDPNGHLWLYGGQGPGSVGVTGYLEDLWEYDPSTHLWTWRNGLQSPPNGEGGYIPNFAEVGLPARINNPGSRSMSQGWADSGGNLWLFSGWNTNPRGVSYLEDDQWEFDPSANEWTLIGYGGGAPVYGTLGMPGPGNVPASCGACATWTDQQGNFWLLGGAANPDGFGPAGNTRDLWWFSPLTDEWTWMGGTTTAAGVYGVLGVPASGISPSARIYPVTWTGKDGNLWLFGGGGVDGENASGALNDLWEYRLSGTSATPAPQAVPPPTFSPAAGTYGSAQSVAISDILPGARIYYTVNGSAPNSDSPLYAGPISVTASEAIQAIAVAAGYINSQPVSASYIINLPAAAAPTFSVPTGTYSSTQTVSLSDATTGATIYYTSDGSTPTLSSTKYTAPITVTKTETIQAIAIANGYSSSEIASATYTINPPPSFTLSAMPTALTVDSGGAGSLMLTVTPQNGFNSEVSFSCSGLPAGLSCSFNPTTVTPSGSAATTQLTITASAQTSLFRQKGLPLFPKGAVMTLAGFLVFLIRRRKRALLISLTLGMFLVPLTSCGSLKSGEGPTPTPTTTSIVTVTATSSAVQKSTTLTLTMN